MTWWSLTDLLITQWILIALRCFWYHLKGLLKGFWWLFRSSKLVKYPQSYGMNEACDRDQLFTPYHWGINTMSSSQYDSLMSNLLNQKHALAKLRVELEERRGRICWYCKRFGHLAYNYRNKKKVKGKPIPQNKFEVIVSRIMQCGMREEIKVKRQETVEEVRCFRCWGIGHYKWECPNIEVERKMSQTLFIP